MKKSIFIYAALALAASFSLASCQKEQGPANPDEGLKSIALSLNFGQAGTKTTIDPELETPWVGDGTYKEFETLDLYFTSANNNIVYYYRASADASDENGRTIWAGLYPESDNPNKGVRFIGMEGISKVYVVANGPDIAGLETSETGLVSGTHNMNELNELISLTDYTTDEQNTMIYAGATQDLALVQAVSSEAGTILVGENGGSDYLAEITIRPALSRLEVSQAGVKTQGTVYFKTDNNGEIVETNTEADATYKVDYSNFKPSLVGVYASNVYRKAPLFPIQTDANAGDLFATPTFEAQTSPVTEGLWTSLASEQKLNAYLCYANYDTANGYGALVSTAYSDQTASGDNWLLFNGQKGGANKVIPFNFFVPYDITSRADAETITALEGSLFPSLHFQFKEQDDTDPIDLTCYKKGTDSWEELSGSELVKIEDLFEWDIAYGSEDGIGFANVVKYYEQDLATEVTLRPGYIYRVQQVIVDPTNIKVSTMNTDSFNVHVVVTVIPFVTENVYPGFE